MTVVDERFWSKVDAAGDCWEWSGGHTSQGYGEVTRGGRLQLAHRYAYELLVGPIPVGLQIDHLCRNRGCLNPDHLEPVSRRTNLMRSWVGASAVNARKTACPKGHAYDEANTMRVRRPQGGWARRCRVCSNENRRQWEAERRRVLRLHIRVKTVAELPTAV